MISIINYLNEALTSGIPSDEPASMTGTVARRLLHPFGKGPLRTAGEVRQAREEEGAAWAGKVAKMRASHADELKKASEAAKKAASTLSNDTSGTEAAGIALKKGAQSAGEAVGGFGKKTMEFAGEHPAAAMGIAGAGLAAALMARRRKNQQ